MKNKVSFFILVSLLLNAFCPLFAQNEITFQVDMSVKILDDSFFPALGDSIVLRGNFNGWEGNAENMTDPDEDSVYVITHDVSMNAGDTIEYKYVIHTINNENNWEFYGDPDNPPDFNRRFILTGSPAVLPVAYFDNDSIFNTDTIVVQSTADSGPGTLRQALQDASDRPAQDNETVIIFDTAVFPPANPAAIQVITELPDIIKDRVTVDASNAGVILDGSNAHTGTIGLKVNSSNNTIKGLQIINFPGEGINFSQNVENTIVGGDRSIGNGPTGEGNVISGNGNWSGIRVEGKKNLIMGNLIGTDATGENANGNTYVGITIVYADSNFIGGPTASTRNIISGNAYGIQIQDNSTNNVIAGNLIGTDINGTAAIANHNQGIGIFDGTYGNVIGGAVPEDRNIISGNTAGGVWMTGSNCKNNIVKGNYIGVDITGLTALANGAHAVAISVGASNNIIGGSNAGEGNVISGNNEAGIYIDNAGTSSNQVFGNIIGLDAGGTYALPNTAGGININNRASGNIIGGSNIREGNVISGNYHFGIKITDINTKNNQIIGNYIGTDAGGTAAIPNGNNGIEIAFGAESNTIGGNTPGTQNIISGNQNTGIEFDNSNSNLVLGNYIGTDVTGLRALANGEHGISIHDGASNNIVGGKSTDSANVIAFNSSNGVFISDFGSDFNRILGNSIFSSGQSGIALENGANKNINPPQINSFNGYTVIGTAAQNARVEFYADAEDEGRFFIGSAFADAQGSFTKTINIGGVPGDYFLTALQDSAGNTSEFSEPVPIPPQAPQNLTAESGSHRVNLSWDKLSTSDLLRYNIYRGTSSPASILLDTVSASAVPDTFYSDFDVSKDSTYFYRLTAVDRDGLESIFSNEASAFPAAADIAVSPTALNFGTNSVPADKTLTLNIANVGNWELKVSSTEIIGPDSLNFEIVSGQGAFNISVSGTPHAVQVRFTSQSAGIKKANLCIISNDLDESPLDVSLTGTAVKPEIAVSPDSLDFGDVNAGTDSLMNLAVSNKGQLELAVDSTVISGSGAERFTFVSGHGSFSIPPGGDAHDIAVKFTPVSVGLESAYLTIYSNDLQNSPLGVPMRGRGVQPDIFVFPDSLAFGNVLVSEDSVLNIDITNTGSTNLIADSTIIYGADAERFSLVSGEGSFSIQPQGPAHNLKIRFSPEELGPKSAYARIYSNDPDENPLDIPLSGRGVQPDISTGPALLQFNSVYIYYDKTLSVSIANYGDGNLKVSAPVIAGSDAVHFSIVSSQNSFIVPPYSIPDTIKVQFAPLTVGSKIAALQIASNDPVDSLIQVPLLGEGIFPNFSDITVSPDSLDFGNVDVNHDSILTLAVGNSGGLDLEVYDSDIIGTGAGLFSFVSSQDSFTVLPADTDSHHIEIKFSPDSEGLKTAVLRLTSNDPDENPFDVTLRGYGFVPDIIGPELSSILYPDTVLQNGSITVSADITDPAGIYSADIFYKAGGGASFIRDPMLLQSGVTYSAAIPSPFITEKKGIEFYLTAQDNLNNTTKSSLYYISTALSDGLANTAYQPAGSALTDYRAFSVPLDLNNPSPASFLAENSLGKYDQTNYRWYDCVNGSLREYPDIGSLLPGRGFLFITNIQDFRFTAGSGKSLNSTVPFSMSLPAGWSLIGSPFYFNVPIDSLSVSTGYFELRELTADSGWVSNTAGLEPWKGYAVWLGQAGDFIIRPGAAGLNKRSAYYSLSRSNENGWLLQISADDGRSADVYNFAGQDINAQDNYDLLDLHKAPIPGRQTRLVFTSEEAEGQQLCADIRAASDEGHVWQMMCQPGADSRYVSLTFNGIKKLPENFDLFLIDPAAGTAYNLRNNASVKFTAGNDIQKEFKLAAGTKQFLNSLDAVLYPAEFRLLQNYPNPFNAITQIVLTLPLKEEVELKLYNVLGQAVKTIFAGNREAGTHNFFLDTKHLASGVYIYKMTAGSFSSSKKCILIK